ncbi:DAGL [Mytilus edulis]|uniref:DAGL n=1 Tax=Mytilus edulis TaxID=6550 RepID=A0A8S3Q3U9_MYTED|nr:DAGL [Mytilus edulis]
MHYRFECFDSECLECEGLIDCVAHKGSKLVITGHSLGAGVCRFSVIASFAHPVLSTVGIASKIHDWSFLIACCGTPSFYAEWSRAEDFVKEIILSPDMLTDHIPDNLMTALEQLSDKDFTPRQRKSPEERYCKGLTTHRKELKRTKKNRKEPKRRSKFFVIEEN